MDEFDRDSNASSEEQEDELMVDADAEANDDAEEQEDDQDHDDENDNDDEDDENEHEADGDNENENENEEDEENNTQPDQPTKAEPSSRSNSAQPLQGVTPKWQPYVRQEALTASSYDIVPTMAAPMATSVNAISITPDLRYWMTGGSDGYIRKYDGPGTINGKTMLTVAQRHPFVESVTKAGVLMSYWENAEPQSPSNRPEDQVLSPVYSLAVHSQALWLLSGLESGGINLQSVRHDEGKRITCLQKHTNAVSVLTLAADEKSVLSGSWDKNIFDWDLNTGAVKRSFDGSGFQISALEARPMGGMPVPAEAGQEDFSTTFSSNNQAPATANGGDFDFSLGASSGAAPNGTTFHNGPNGTAVNGHAVQDGQTDAQGSPANDSLFGGSAGGDDLFGDNFGDDDNEFSRAMMQDTQQDGQQPSNIADYDMPVSSFEGGPVQPPADHPMTDGPANGVDASEQVNGAAHQSAENHLNSSMDSGTLPATLPSEDTSLSTDPSQQPQELHSLQPPQEPQQPDGVPPSTQDGTINSEYSSTAVFEPKPEYSSAVFAAPPPTHADTSQTSDSTFLSASIDGTLRIWDRRAPNPVGRIGNRPGVPPWCMGACWSPDGNWIYVGRRNGTVEEFSLAKATSRWQPERVFKFPPGSGPVSAVRPMANGRHLICASHDILRLYDLRAEERAVGRHAPPPFLIVPGPPRAGVISSLYIDSGCRYMLSAAGTRGWEGTSTEVLIGYEIGVSTNR